MINEIIFGATILKEWSDSKIFPALKTKISLVSEVMSIYSGKW